jgi:hypothetical protein
MPIPRKITFAPDQMDELEEEKQRRLLDGFSIKEIHNSDGSVTLILTPAETKGDAAIPEAGKASGASGTALTPEGLRGGESSPPVQSPSAGPPGIAVGDAGTASASTPSSTPSVPGSLAWGAKVSEGFRNKVRAIAVDLGCNPDFLMAAMAFETGETFSPSIRNPQSGATGLIQFMPNTAKALGTTTNDLANMSAEHQLDFVAKYFNDHKGKLHTLEDVYMAILWPAAVGKDNAYVLFSKPSLAYEQNKGLDSNKDGNVTKAEAADKVQAKLEKGRKPENAR